ncbi:MAG: hypothetical protein HY788_01670 [Deltaproteobacteria bacterium]|nr:hypothetical protein [Deltaproteobacteria bacterium]
MEAFLEDIADRYHIHASGSIHRMGSASCSWRFSDVSGKQWVLKTGRPDARTFTILQGFALLFPPFRHPEPTSRVDDPYLLYPFMDGVPLDQGLFETPEVVAQVLEVIDRLPVLMRSLALIPQFERALRLRNEGFSPSRSREASRPKALADPGETVSNHHQRQDIDCSFQWTKDRANACCDFMRTSCIWPETLLDAFKAYAHSMQSIHFAIAGNNLSHTALVPEHLVLDDHKTLCILGWRIEPRPRFFMMYSYLAWEALYSGKPDPFDDYRARLLGNRSRPFYDQHLLVAAFCLLDQVERCLSSHAFSQAWVEKARPAEDLFRDCVERLDTLKTGRPALSNADL